MEYFNHTIIVIIRFQLKYIILIKMIPIMHFRSTNLFSVKIKIE